VAKPALSPIMSESDDEDDDTVYIGWGHLKKLR
jgi:hypothetical protein